MTVLDCLKAERRHGISPAADVFLIEFIRLLHGHLIDHHELSGRHHHGFGQIVDGILGSRQQYFLDILRLLLGEAFHGLQLISHVVIHQDGAVL